MNYDLMKKFKCSGQGGMRKSNKTNTLVLISDETKGLYEGFTTQVWVKKAEMTP